MFSVLWIHRSATTVDHVCSPAEKIKVHACSAVRESVQFLTMSHALLWRGSDWKQVTGRNPLKLIAIDIRSQELK